MLSSVQTWPTLCPPARVYDLCGTTGPKGCKWFATGTQSKSWEEFFGSVDRLFFFFTTFQLWPWLRTYLFLFCLNNVLGFHSPFVGGWQGQNAVGERERGTKRKTRPFCSVCLFCAADNPGNLNWEAIFLIEIWLVQDKKRFLANLLFTPSPWTSLSTLTRPDQPFRVQVDPRLKVIEMEMKICVK